MQTPGWLSAKEYRSIYRRVPRLVVDLVIRDPRGILLVKRSIPPYRGYWHLPGGRVRLGERLEAVGRRIAHEETGLRIALGRIIGIIQYPSRGAVDPHTVGIVFRARPIGGRLEGSRRGERVSFFRSLPLPIVAVHRKFLAAHGLVRRARRRG